MYKVYGDGLSGNCYKIKLLMSLLDIQHQWISVNILNGETQTPEFKSINQNGKIPVLQISEDQFLTESNAILNFLAEGTHLLPPSGLARAKVLQWQFFEQYSHEPYVAVARFINRYLGLPDERLAEYQAKQTGGHKALQVMDNQLEETLFLVSDQATIADVSLYAYTHVANEGGFDLALYPNIQRWLRAVEDLPGYQPMTADPT